jgi:ActR/RegA family two-component response regulator
MANKKVLIIEDKEPQRMAIHESLAVRGFEVYSAGRVIEARQLAEEHWKELDVAVLDMRLEDPDEPNTTGADIGIEFRMAKNSFPPESLIYSAYAEIDYYRLALKLGVAVYLSKAEDTLLDVVRHVRVLALRRALNGENPVTADKVARIAAQSESRSEAIVKFCQEIMKPEFESCLGPPFVVLFSTGNHTQNCADNGGLPQGSSQFYHTLQALAHGKGNLTEPFILEVGELETPTDPDTEKLYEKLNLAAFIPLSISQEFRLSIGILQENEHQTPVPEDARALCKVLAQYLRPTVLENMLSIWSQWTELRTTRSSMAKACLFVGQELEDMLPTKDNGGVSISEDSLGRLRNLAADLNDTGQLLAHLESRRWNNKSEPVSLREVAEVTWGWITQAEERPERSFKVEGDCNFEADRGDLEIAISRLLQWFAQRRPLTPFDEEPLISVKCGEGDAGPTIIFEDRSQRLNKKLRADMFAPFTQAVPIPFEREAEHQESNETALETSDTKRKPVGRYLPLYLAKMLVEGRYHGTLEDRSDEDDLKDLSYRHRIVMQFPRGAKHV